MKSLLCSIILSGILFTGSCKSKKNATEAATNNNTSTSTSTSTTTEQVKNLVQKYRLIVSFYSIGTGVNGNAITKLDNFLSKHPKKPQSEILRRGREGETEYLFNLKELSDSEKVAFITEIKNLIGNLELVRIEENAERSKN